MSFLRGAAFAAASLFAAGQGQAAEPDREFCREIFLGYTSGDIDGHLQAPFADFPDVEPLRPSFSDLGYEGFHQLNFEGSYVYGRNRFYLHYDRTRLDDNQVELSLRSLDGNITPPVPLVVSSQLDLYRFGYQRLFGTELFGRKLTLAPGVELAALDFDYRQRLDTTAAPIVQPALDPDAFADSIVTGDIPAGVFDGAFVDGGFVIAVPTEADRSYTETSLRIGAEAEYQVSEKFSLTAELYDSIPLEERPEIFTAMIGMRFEVYAGGHASVYLLARAGRETLEYEDGDGASDDVRAEYRDLIQGGISVRF